jgi:hypothetical protein
MHSSKIELLKFQIEKTEKEGKVLKTKWLYGKLLWATCNIVMQDIINEIKQGVKSE